ncbi:AAA family ATPase [Saccharospirillum salsuginis]|uniref:Thymidylate kinase-like domain-containing protein n=1 Tax=Saccharospirillum salsuginis TaxID=418750 RepID=A0A918KB85_9GAMM|nr:AAA family ATPase [Saccharospirillum salsuginis]GGX57613.1 hypothetical protein GCM10007392_26510 [Saccharospirillum salsuginis]
MSSSKLFVLCGVDGCGKSTLVERVSNEITDLGYETDTLKKSIKTNTNIVCDYWDGVKDWSGGEFAQLVSIATGMDFINHYDQNIRPLLNQGKVIICDRYSYCYMSYMAAVNTPKDYHSMFANVHVPNKVYYIKVPPEVAIERHYKRGGPSEDETPDVIRHFSDSYDQLFKDMPIVETIDNTSTLESATSKIVRSVLKEL